MGMMDVTYADMRARRKAAEEAYQRDMDRKRRHEASMRENWAVIDAEFEDVTPTEPATKALPPPTV